MAANNNTVHCVRCHQSFNLNHPGARCQIPHVFEEFPSSTDYTRAGYSNIYRYESRCCGKKALIMEEGSGNGDYKFKGRARNPCVTLTHTIDPAAVTYNGRNVVECEAGPGGHCEREPLSMNEAPHFQG